MKRIFCVLISACLLLGCTAFAAASGVFTDVPENTWYTDAVGYVVEQGYFNGVTETRFDPSGSMTRGMFITVLGRMANVSAEISRTGQITRTSVNVRSEANTDSKVVTMLDKGNSVTILDKESNWFQIEYNGKKGYVRDDLMEENAADGAFSDVPASMYYAPYVQWAVEKSMVSGITSSLFGPDQLITREQLCAILYNFSKAYDVTLKTEASAATFDDDVEISSWARDAVYTFRSMGIINGRDETHFAPTEGATRAEVAVILKRFVDAIGENNLPNARVAFGVPVPENNAVGDDYFADACFIGHSMVVGMSDYFKLPGATYYAVNGISTGGLLSYENFPLEDKVSAAGEKTAAYGTILQALTEKQDEFKKVYILLGTNELGPETTHVERYAANMGKLIDLVHETQPNATVYVLATYPISEARSNQSTSFSKANVLTFNERLLTISAEKKVYYLDTYSLFADENGYMPATSCASDGIHILYAQYAVLLQYLKTHTV